MISKNILTHMINNDTIDVEKGATDRRLARFILVEK